MTWTAQAHDRQGWWNAEAPNYDNLRDIIIKECRAGRLWGPLFIKVQEGSERDMTSAFIPYGLRTDDRPEPMIDDEEEDE